MKLIIENWRGYLQEEDKNNVVLLKDFVKSLAIIAQASDDAETELEERRTGAGGRKRESARRAKTAKIVKQRAGLAGIKMKDFTPEQRRLYDLAKKEFEMANEAEDIAAMNTLAHGDILELPIVKQLVNTFPSGFKSFLTSLATQGACQGAITLTCLIMFLHDPGQG